MARSLLKISIIGSGASAIYFLKHWLDHASTMKKRVGEIAIFEKNDRLGMGMPYNPDTTDHVNMANIPSEEMPPLMITFADWLRQQNSALLADLHIVRAEISDHKIYSRIALGMYLHDQYRTIVSRLKDHGFSIVEHPQCHIVDLQDDAENDSVTLKSESGRTYHCDRVIIVKGHSWPLEDRPEIGYYKSPWPIAKILPEKGTHYNFPIGTLGASLSAFDVIASLSHRHGEFLRQFGKVSYRPDVGTESFKIVMHAHHGRLPHLRYAIAEFDRKIYQDVSREDLLAMIGSDGFLRLEDYYNRVCRPALLAAFRKDDLIEIVELLEDPKFTLKDFVEKMSDEHDYPDAFEGMRSEMIEAKESVEQRKPIFWKEAIDDLIYTLNFHAEYLPAEDHLTLHSLVLPFLMNVIAAMPLLSGEQLLALHDAGKLEIISASVNLAEEQNQEGKTVVELTDDAGKMEKQSYEMFIDCSGQKPLEIEEYPFPSLVTQTVVRKARALFADLQNKEQLSEKESSRIFYENDHVLLHIGGIDVDGFFRVVGENGTPCSRIYDVTFPHTSGVRPYSYGLQSCSDTGDIVIRALLEDFSNGENAHDSVDETKIYEKI